MKFSLELALNPTSMGQMALGIAAELCKRDIIPNLFPIGNIDLSHFKAPEGFEQWLRLCLETAPRKFNRDQPSLRYFHIAQSLAAIGNYSRLYTVHETNKLTETEVNILKRHDSVLVPSNYNKEVFEKHGIKTGLAPNFFDKRHIYKIDRPARDYVTWGLIGKLENRKHTARIIDAWCTKYGGNKDHRLNLNVWNFHLFNELPMEQRLAAHKQTIQNALKYELPWNCNFLPFLNPEQINQCYNEQDISLSALSGAEGFNLPALNSLCLGKRTVALNAHAHKDFCDEQNSVLVSSSGMRDIVDNAFFRKDIPYNQGEFYIWDKEEVMAAMDEALNRPEPNQEEAAKLAEKFDVSHCVDALIEGF